jgi:hypothetical protein
MGNFGPILPPSIFSSHSYFASYNIQRLFASLRHSSRASSATSQAPETLPASLPDSPAPLPGTAGGNPRVEMDEAHKGTDNPLRELSGIPLREVGLLGYFP